MIAITGASGLVGGNLVRALLAQQRPLRALVHHDRRALQGLPLDIVTADLNDPDSLTSAFQGVDVVYHLASTISIGLNNWQDIQRVNVEGTRNVIAACRKCHVRRLVYFSSIHAYQQAPFDQALDESRPLLTDQDAAPYERSKAAAERLVRQAVSQGLDAVTLIPTAIIGPNDFRPSYLGQALQLLARGHIPALVRGGYDWVDVRDVVQGAIAAEQHAQPGSRYILSGQWRSLMDFARLTARLCGRHAPLVAVPVWLADLVQPLMAKLARINGAQPLYTRPMLAAMRSNRHISHARAAAELDYKPRPFEETLRDTLDWFEEQARRA